METQPGQHLALVRDQLVEDDVVGRDAVGGDEEEMLAVDLVDLPDLSRSDMRKRRHVAAE